MKNDPLFTVVGELIKNGKLSKWMDIFQEVHVELIAKAIGKTTEDFEFLIQWPLHLTIRDLCDISDQFRVPRMLLFRMVEAHILSQQI